VPTEDGWEPSPRIEPDSPLLVWKQVPGTDVNLQVRNDDAGTVMLAYAADYHANVELLRDPDSACYTPTNSVSTSNHLNATAMDLNWNSHPFQVRGTFTAVQMAALRDLLAYYDGVIFWAGDWDSPIDEMHHQMDYGSASLNLGQWIKDHIRPDGFSHYKRDVAAPTPQPTPTPVPDAKADAVKVLYDAVPEIDEERAAQLVDQIMRGLALSECNNVKRIAMWLAQIGYESGGFVYTEEIAKNGRYAPYIGRTWIQITWQSNYHDFGQWCAGKGLVDDPNFFVNNYAALADPKWAAIGPAWYWTVQRPQINSMCDNGDLVGVTQAINGGTNGLSGVANSRTDRWNQALGLGDRLLALATDFTPEPQGPLPTGDPFKDWMAKATDRELLEYLVAQLGPGDPTWSAKGSTLRDELWKLSTPAVRTAAKKVEK
jgi:predicted chitinase